MTHHDADTLLKFALKTLEESESSSIAEHLAACEKCRDLQQKILGELARLEEVEIHIEVPAPPGLQRRSRLPLAVSRWAAVLAIGFLLGYMTAQLSDPVRPVVVQQRLIPTGAEVSLSGYVPCQAIDVGTTIGGTR